MLVLGRLAPVPFQSSVSKYAQCPVGAPNVGMITRNLHCVVAGMKTGKSASGRHAHK